MPAFLKADRREIATCGGGRHNRLRSTRGLKLNRYRVFLHESGRYPCASPARSARRRSRCRSPCETASAARRRDIGAAPAIADQFLEQRSGPGARSSGSPQRPDYPKTAVCDELSRWPRTVRSRRTRRSSRADSGDPGFGRPDQAARGRRGRPRARSRPEVGAETVIRPFTHGFVLVHLQPVSGPFSGAGPAQFTAQRWQTGSVVSGGCRGGTPRRRVGWVRRGRERAASVSEAERSPSSFRSGELRESQDCDGNGV